MLLPLSQRVNSLKQLKGILYIYKLWIICQGRLSKVAVISCNTIENLRVQDKRVKKYFLCAPDKLGHLVGCVEGVLRDSYVTGASNWYWLTVWQGKGGMFFISSVSSVSFLFFCLPCSSLSSPLLSLLSLFSLVMGDNTKWPRRVDVSLNPITINAPDKSLYNRASLGSR